MSRRFAMKKLKPIQKETNKKKRQKKSWRDNPKLRALAEVIYKTATLYAIFFVMSMFAGLLLMKILEWTKAPISDRWVEELLPLTMFGAIALFRYLFQDDYRFARWKGTKPFRGIFFGILGAAFIFMFAIMFEDVKITRIQNPLVEEEFWLHVMGYLVTAVAMGYYLRDYLFRLYSKHYGVGTSAIVLTTLVTLLEALTSGGIPILVFINIYLKNLTLYLVMVAYQSFWASAMLHFSFNISQYLTGIPFNGVAPAGALFQLQGPRLFDTIGVDAYGVDGRLSATILWALLALYFVMQIRIQSSGLGGKDET